MIKRKARKWLFGLGKRLHCGGVCVYMHVLALSMSIIVCVYVRARMAEHNSKTGCTDGDLGLIYRAEMRCTVPVSKHILLIPAAHTRTNTHTHTQSLQCQPLKVTVLQSFVCSQQNSEQCRWMKPGGQNGEHADGRVT